ncbi:serine hydrolase [Pedobacter sp. PAMC26386]|nr:serine hydrolase [Pedobacter sp. PAMC26386]
MNLKGTITAIIFFGMLLPFLSKAQQTSKTDSIDLFLMQKMRNEQIPALQLAVIRQGKIIKLNSYGTANPENSIPATDQSIFSINSITKAFVGIAIMQLAEEEKLKVSDPISLYIDSLPVPWQKITLKQVLTHTSGLPDITDADGEQLLGDGDENLAWKKVRMLPLEFNTGDKFSYNQTGYVILGKIITKLSGVHFTKFIEDRQFKAAGMDLTRFGDSFDIVHNSAGAYTLFKYVGGRRTKLDSPGTAYKQFPVFYRTAAGILSTARDMANWIIALQNGKLLKQQSSIETLWEPALLNNGKTGGFNQLTNGYALGWPTVTRASHPAVAPVGGGRSAVFIYTKDDLAIVVLTNLMGSNPDQYVDEIAGYYIPEMHQSNGFGLPPAIQKLRAALLKHGFEQAPIVLANLKKKTPSFELNENELNAWAYLLLKNKETKQALSIFKLNVKLYPESANTYDSLGEMQELMGDTNAALLNYKKSLALNPDHKNAFNRIKILSGN